MSPESSLISDERIRNILARIVPILHKGIEQANSFKVASFGEKQSSATSMSVDEVDLWDRHFHIRRLFQGGVTAGELFVPDYDLLDPTTFRSMLTHPKQPTADGRPTYGVLLEERIWTPVRPFYPNEAMQFVLHPRAYFESPSQTDHHAGLDKAFIDFQIFAKDALGRTII